MRHIFIVNENSGTKEKRKNSIEAINDICSTQQLDYNIELTNTVDQSNKIARYYSVNYPDAILYSVGGDGTLNTIVNSIDTEKTTIGIVPIGTGNDAYKSFCNTDEFDVAALKRTICEQTSEITYHDLMQVNDKMAVNIVSVGLDAKVARNLKLFRNLPIPGSLKYNLSAIYSIMKEKFIDISMHSHLITEGKNGVVTYKTDGSKYNRNNTMVLIAICNGQYYGSKYHISPLSSTQDRMLNIVEARKMSLPHILKLFSGINDGKHLEDEYCRYYESVGMRIDSNQGKIDCNIDGEIEQYERIDITLSPRTLKLKRATR